jgi:hypothetical protein
MFIPSTIINTSFNCFALHSSMSFFTFFDISSIFSKYVILKFKFSFSDEFIFDWFSFKLLW